MSEHVEAAPVPAAEYKRLQAVYGMTAALIRAADITDIYDEALKGLLAAVGADRASVLVFDEAGVMRFVAWRGLSDGYVRAVDGHSPWRPETPDAVPIVVADAALDESLGEYRDVILGEGIRALVFVPLVWQSGVLGKFMLYFDRPHAPSAADIRLAESIAGHVTFALVRRRADEALLRRTREFATLADHAPDVIARFDAELRHLYVNPAVTRSSGIPPEQFIGRTNAELGMPPEVVEQWSAPLRDVFATGRSRRVEFSFPGVGGEQRFEAMLTPERDGDGTVISVLAVTRDVTERHRAARTLGLLARTSDVVVSSLEPADMLAAFAELLIEDFAESCAVDLLSAHGEAVERVALATRDPARGARIRSLDALYPTPPDAPIAPAMVIRSGEPALYAEVTEAQLRAASRDETHLTLLRELGAASALCVPLRARGRTLGAVTLVNHTPQRSFSNSDLALAVQLTERVALALDNARLYAEAVAASRTKSTFLATMSHELRTPLNAILGYADIMAVGIGGALSDTQQLHLDRIQASARHLLAIIEGLLSFTRLEAGGDRVHAEHVELGELVAQALEMVRPAAEAKQLELRGVVDAAVEIETDRSKLLQILLNLLGNAVKFTTRGGITTAIGVDAATGEALVRVGDTGIGIEEQDLERIFEPFWQVESGMTRRLGGTGLGLTVSRQIAELLGGTLHVESVAGQGSVFTIRLPRRAAAAIVAATAAATEPR